MLKGSSIVGVLVYVNFIMSLICVFYFLLKVDVTAVALYTMETRMVFCVLDDKSVCSCCPLFSFGSAEFIFTL
jgi:hypothetical protein